MLTLREAADLIMRQVPPPREAAVPLADALGLALAEDVGADRDQPPFDRSAMDGFAVRAADVPGTLEIVEEIAAGSVPTKRVEPGRCARIMTGAPLPDGADAVVKVEETRTDGPRVTIGVAAVPGQHISRRAEDVRAGDIVLRHGATLRPAEIGLLATVGRAKVRVFRRPSCAMLATGNELVEVGATPGPGQIRNSNAHGVAAQVRSMGFACDVLPTARDTLDSLRECIRDGLRRDVLILSGGVSVGGYDLVIEALKAEGVEAVLHKVAIKPGKPFFFGVRGDRRIFGLPGNPVSSFVIFEVFVRPFLGAAAGISTLRREVLRARLTQRYARPMDRTCFLPARLERDGNDLAVGLVAWNGSADVAGLARADALAIVPANTEVVEKGAWIDVMILDPCA